MALGVLLVLLLGGAGDAFAQDREAPAPFQQLRVRGAFGGARVDDPAARYWRPRPEWSVEVAGAYHGGWLALQADRLRFQARSEGLPAVTGAGLWAGWLWTVQLPLDLEVEGGALLGGVSLTDEAGRIGERESEVGVAGQLALSGPAVGPVRPYFRGRVRRIFFERPLDLASASAGVEWRAGLPRGVASALAGEDASPQRSDRPERTVRSSLAGVRTLTRRELDRAGATRMADLYRLLPTWTTSTVDHHAWSVVPPGGLLFGAPHPTVLVDGIPWPVSVLGVASLERLPISLADVDSIRVVEGPLLESGEFVPGAVLSIHTRRGRGLDARASHQEGNPARDPGPLALTPLATPNVERIGRYTTYRVAWGGDEAAVWAGRANGTRYPTDRSEVVRYEQAREGVGGKSYIHTRRTAGGASWRGEGARARILGGVVRTDDYFFLPVHGTEVLARNRQGGVGAHGTLDLAEDARLQARSSFTRRTVAAHLHDPRPGFGFQEDRAAVTLRWERDGSALGVHYDVRRIRAAETGSHTRAPDEPVRHARLFARRLLPGGVRLDASLSQTAGETGAALVATRGWRAGDRAWLRARASYAVEPFSTSDDFTGWWVRGYRPGLHPAPALDLEGTPEARQMLVSDVRGGVRMAGSVRLDGGVWIRRDAEMVIPEPRFRVVDGIPERVGGDTVAVRVGERGSVAGAWIGVEGGRAAWRWSVEGRRDVVLTGSGGFRAARESVPAARAAGSLLWAGLPDLTVRLAARWRSEAQWTAYGAVNSEARSTVPARTTLDLTVQKWAWEGRLRALVAVRDLLERDRSLHPIGVTPGLRLLVQGDLRIR